MYHSESLKPHFLPVMRLIIGLVILNGCCMTKSLSNCGIAHDSPMDIKQATLSDDGQVFLVTDRSVSWGSRNYGMRAKNPMIMKCNINDSLKNVKDITTNVNHDDYGDYSTINHPLSQELTKYLRTKSNHHGCPVKVY